MAARVRVGLRVARIGRSLGDVASGRRVASTGVIGSVDRGVVAPGATALAGPRLGARITPKGSAWVDAEDRAAGQRRARDQDHQRREGQPPEEDAHSPSHRNQR